MTPTDDFRELLRLAYAAISAAREGRGWDAARNAHSAHYAAIVQRCKDPAYRAAYTLAVSGTPHD